MNLKLEAIVKELQHELNIEGAKLSEDGQLGTYTLAAYGAALTGRPVPLPSPISNVGQPLTASEIAFLRKHCPVTIPESDAEIALCTQLRFSIDNYGANENDSGFNKTMAAYWYLLHYDSKSIQGSNNAWCALNNAVSFWLEGYSIKGLDPSAISGLNYPNRIPAYKFGCSAVIQHAGGGHHITMLVAPRYGLGGNQGDSINIERLADTDKIMGYLYPVKAA